MEKFTIFNFFFLSFLQEKNPFFSGARSFLFYEDIFLIDKVSKLWLEHAFEGICKCRNWFRWNLLGLFFIESILAKYYVHPIDWNASWYRNSESRDNTYYSPFAATNGIHSFVFFTMRRDVLMNYSFTLRTALIINVQS